MEVVAAGEQPIQADLVFVHGLRGDRIKTWEADKVVWPRDLLPVELPNVRVMSYGYDACMSVVRYNVAEIKLWAANVMNFFSNASQSSIFQHSINLLEDLQRKRRMTEEVSQRVLWLLLRRNTSDNGFQRDRPIIFVGHSLGGLVIKDALIKSNKNRANGRNPRTAAISGKTYGIVFLGTPHRGGNHTAWAKIATNLATMVLKDHNTKIIDALTRGSEILERLQDSFCGIVGRIQIFSFFEDIAFGASGKIVDDDSASLGLACERKQWIPANHSEMCKFKSASELGYERVAGGIAELIEDAMETRARGDGLYRLIPVWAKPEALGFQGDARSRKGETFDDGALAETDGSMHKILRRSNRSPVHEGDLPDTSRLAIEAVEDPFRRTNSRTTRERLVILSQSTSNFNNRKVGRTIVPIDDEYLSKLTPTDLSNLTHSKLAVGKEASEDSQRYSKSASLEVKLSWACKEGDLGLVRYLIAQGVAIDTGSQYSLLVLMSELDYQFDEYKLLRIVALWVSRGADVNASDLKEVTLLMHATSKNCRAVVNYLLQAGADIDRKDADKYTALMYAAYLGYEWLTADLCRAHAKTDIANEDGQTALHLASGLSQADTVRVLLTHGADYKIRSKTGRTALMYALRSRDPPGENRDRTLTYLLKPEYKETFDLTDSDGASALIYATKTDNLRGMKLLLDHGVDPDGSDAKSASPLLIAARRSLDSVRLLLEAGMDVNKQYYGHGTTALMASSQVGLVDVVRELLRHGADTTLKDHDGYTAIQYAGVFHHDEVVQILEKSKPPDIDSAKKSKASLLRPELLKGESALNSIEKQRPASHQLPANSQRRKPTLLHQFFWPQRPRAENS
ncbi:uncharacterized protein KY384_005686 [Bacidia gigantensis]|uniref:uncharacterized protein n=1 Tax=Bacidia gigantensis TaxID=2732470 RepID=UPI001D03E99D|nr:uncharacterized protein KY384_005686 [Bacidia gigantensis]KAG8529051.1 hypothetical protein KY384_005686 [Bacidia gigantensis]